MPPTIDPLSTSAIGRLRITECPEVVAFSGEDRGSFENSRDENMKLSTRHLNVMKTKCNVMH